MKEIGKVELVPAIFNINEPLLFGLPIVYNVNLFVPFIGAPMACSMTTYTAFAKDYRATTLANASRPEWLDCYGFLERRGSCDRQRDYRLPIWYPFIKRYDNKLLKQEEVQKSAEVKYPSQVWLGYFCAYVGGAARRRSRCVSPI